MFCVDPRDHTYIHAFVFELEGKYNPPRVVFPREPKIEVLYLCIITRVYAKYTVLLINNADLLYDKLHLAGKIRWIYLCECCPVHSTYISAVKGKYAEAFRCAKSRGE